MGHERRGDAELEQQFGDATGTSASTIAMAMVTVAS
jgi:hypothetical protein